MTVIKNLYATQIGTLFSWREVSEIHRSRNGIYQRHGRLLSLLTDFGRHNACYPDFRAGGRAAADKVIFYTGSGRRGDQKIDAANRALIDAVGKNVAVPLFNKLSVGRWEFLGFWSVEESAYVRDEATDRMVWRFRLCRTEHFAGPHQ